MSQPACAARAWEFLSRGTTGPPRDPQRLSNWSLALMMRFRSPQLSQLRFAAVEFVSITAPDSLNRVRLGPESAVCVLPHRPGLPVPRNHWGGTILREPKPALRQDRIGAGP